MTTKEQKKITRIEVIDETWRVYVWYDKDVQLSVQDNWKTLKVFVKRAAK